MLNVDDGYVFEPDRAKLVPGAIEAVRTANENGFRTIIVTNQSGVARGYFSEEKVKSFLNWMSEHFRENGAILDVAYYCAHLPEAPVEEYRIRCDGRKPAPGLVLRAIAEWSIDPSASLFVGDSPRDMEAATAAGVRAALFPGGNLDEFLRSHL